MVESEASFYMHYESEGVDSVWPSELIQNDNMIGETDRRSIPIYLMIMQMKIKFMIEVRSFVEFRWPGVIVCT